MHDKGRKIKETVIKSLMKEIKISTREFLRNYAKYKKDIVIIANRGESEGVYIPYKIWKKQKTKKEKMGKFTLDELLKYTAPGGGPNLSKQIDEICYKNPNPLKDGLP